MLSDRLAEIAKSSARGGFFLFLGNILSTFILALGSIIIARLLGPSGYGIYSLSFVLPSLLISLFSFGIDPALTMFSARFRSEGRIHSLINFLRAGFLFKLLISFVAFVISFIFSDYFALYILNRPELGSLVRIASIIIVFGIIYNGVTATFIGLDRMENNAVLAFFQSIFKVTVGPLLIILGFGVLGAITGHIMGYIVASLLGVFILLIRQFNIFRVSLSDDLSFSESVKAMIGYGFPLYLSSLLSVFLGQYQLMILAYYVSDFDIGNFNAAVNMSTMINILAVPITTSLFPAFAKLNPKSERDEIKRLFDRAVKYSSIIIIPVSVIVMIFSKELVRLFYGSNYLSASSYLSLYVIIFLYAGLGSLILGSFFNGIGETRIMFWITLINGITLIPSAFIFTKLYAIPGLITAILLSNLTSLIYALITAYRKFAIAPNFNSLSRVYLASILSTILILPLFYVSFNYLVKLFLGSFLYLACYLTILPLIKGLHNSDIENLKLIFDSLSVVKTLMKPILFYERTIINKFKKQ